MAPPPVPPPSQRPVLRCGDCGAPLGPQAKCPNCDGPEMTANRRKSGHPEIKDKNSFFYVGGGALALLILVVVGIIAVKVKTALDDMPSSEPRKDWQQQDWAASSPRTPNPFVPMPPSAPTRPMIPELASPVRLPLTRPYKPAVPKHEPDVADPNPPADGGPEWKPEPAFAALLTKTVGIGDYQIRVPDSFQPNQASNDTVMWSDPINNLGVLITVVPRKDQSPYPEIFDGRRPQSPLRQGVSAPLGDRPEYGRVGTIRVIRVHTPLKKLIRLCQVNYATFDEKNFIMLKAYSLTEEDLAFIEASLMTLSKKQ